MFSLCNNWYCAATRFWMSEVEYAYTVILLELVIGQVYEGIIETQRMKRMLW